MRLVNAVIFMLPAVAAAIVVWLLSPTLGAPLAFLVILDDIISVIALIIFVDYLRKGRRYERDVLRKARRPSRRSYRVAIVIPTYNEPPRLVAETAVASKMALGELGDVYVLDDSTDENIKREVDRYAKELVFHVVRRGSRKGYKAGAVNSWLAKYGDKYDLFMILDADQRPMPGIFEHTLQFFDDPAVAFVQVPQYYSGLDNMISLSAYIQQIPFLRVTMRGRQARSTAFSLGSGTIFRVKYLKEVGGLYEGTVTEDIYTSALLHERGFKSVYVDLPLIWHGTPPRDLPAYISQQNRWSLGGFQLLGRLLSMRLPTARLMDYFNGVYYWLHVGILAIADLIAPVLFLLTGYYFMGVSSAVKYMVLYIPFFIYSLTFYLIPMRRYRYGLREYFYHQGIQFVASLPTTMAFLEWVARRKKPFKVTPKAGRRTGLTIYHLYYILAAALLAAAILVGTLKAFLTKGLLLEAYLVNLFWAGWWLLIASLAIYISLSPRVPPQRAARVAQTYEGLEDRVMEQLACAAELESSIARYYYGLASKFPGSPELEHVASESVEHARTYSTILESVKGRLRSSGVSCTWAKEYMEAVSASAPEAARGPEGLVRPQEEVAMYVFASMLLEVGKYTLNEDELRAIERIAEDELEHEELLKDFSEGE